MHFKFGIEEEYTLLYFFTVIFQVFFCKQQYFLV